MGDFLRNLVMAMAAAALMEHLLPSGPMGRMGRLVLGLALILTVLSGLMPPSSSAQAPAVWLQEGQTYDPGVYEAMARRAWEAACEP